MRAPPNRIVSSKIRNLQPNVNPEMQLISVTKSIDSQAIGVLKVGAPGSAPAQPPLGYTANQIHREHFFLPRLIIRSSDIHAAGCFALENIAKSTRILEYTGERITKAEGDIRYEGRLFTYLFGVGDGEVVIDGHGMAMFVNHSCDPNCETDEEGGRVYIAAIRDIAAGEELTYDYCLYDGDDEAPCHCGSKSCRGSMYSPEELKKMARAAARKKKQAEPAAKGNGAGRKVRNQKRAK